MGPGPLGLGRKYKFSQKCFWQNIRRNILSMMTVWQWSNLECCAVSIPGGFQNMTGLCSEQPSLISYLILFWTEGWTRDLLRSFSPELSCDSMMFLWLKQKPLKLSKAKMKMVQVWLKCCYVLIICNSWRIFYFTCSDSILGCHSLWLH